LALTDLKISIKPSPRPSPRGRGGLQFPSPFGGGLRRGLRTWVTVSKFQLSSQRKFFWHKAGRIFFAVYFLCKIKPNFGITGSVAENRDGFPIVGIAVVIKENNFPPKVFCNSLRCEFWRLKIVLGKSAGLLAETNN